MARMENEATIAILRESEADLIAKNLMLTKIIEELEAKLEPKFDHTKVINRSVMFEDFLPVTEFMEKFSIVHKEPNEQELPSARWERTTKELLLFGTQ